MPHSAVVRIYATEQEPDYDSPWQARSPSSSTGSGVVVSPRKILTSAHVVANATFIQIQRISDTNKLVAKVVGICHDADLALLEVESASFMKGIKIPAIGDLPARRDRVAVVGFPVGGDEVSITEGVVSRIEVQRYSHSQRYLLAVTVDAAINSGNSGGPVFRKGKVVGIAFQGLNDADGIGEMVPSPIIKNFLSGIKGSHKMSLPTLGLATQNLENPVLRQQLAMGKADSGKLVLKVEYGSSCHGIVLEGDTLLKIGTTKIANNSTVAYRGKHRTRFDVILGEKQVGDTLKLQVLRAGKKKNLSIVLKEKVDLVPRSQYDVTPSYFIFGGLVFQSLCRDYLTTWDNWWEKAPKEFLYLYYSGSRTTQKHETVILSQILADEINVGYEGLYSESVLSVNGKKPKDIRHFVSLVENSVDLVEIRTSSNSRIVFSMKLARARTTPILERYRIERDRSSDLLPSMQAVEQSP
ncbi:MAG: trypsin-like peptidase domain-containing protein, partial [Kofleriaceae bacterium]|nr:trypsin-like peptidase domain-containing protein [Kofleriaceae bacterium]